MVLRPVYLIHIYVGLCIVEALCWHIKLYSDVSVFWSFGKFSLINVHVGLCVAEHSCWHIKLYKNMKKLSKDVNQKS